MGRDRSKAVGAATYAPAGAKLQCSMRNLRKWNDRPAAWQLSGSVHAADDHKGG